MSDQDNSLFKNTESPTQAQTPAAAGTAAGTTPPSNPWEDQLKGILNERGEPKYRTPEDAFNGLKHAQEYIPTLKQQLAERDTELSTLRAEAAKAKELEATLQRLTQQRQEDAPPASKGLSEEQIADLVQRTLSQREQQAATQRNVESVVNAVKTAFGDKAEERFYNAAKEIGMSVAEFNAFAAKSPKAVLQLLNIKEGTQPSKTALPSPHNTSAFQPTQETFVGSNKTSLAVGATTQQVVDEFANARKLVDEVHASGKTMYDLTDPKVYFKYFK